MRIIFKELIIHNFLSFGDAVLKLENRGFTLISGENHNPEDNAKSNGSGKSAIWEAISWCLVGETIRGIKNGVINLNNLEEECWVSLSFTLDEHSYLIKRSVSNKNGSKLQFIVDGVDKSGKGIRDTEKILNDHLPELTSSLIGSVIILGQGLPQRFSNNTPSGRKEVLEKLSKSDFMIEDIKNKLTSRQSTLNNKIRDVEMLLVSSNSSLEVLKQQRNKLNSTLEDLINNPVDDSLISDLESKISLKSNEINDLEAELKVQEEHQHRAADNLNKLTDLERSDRQTIEKKFKPILVEISEKVLQRKSDVKSLEDSIIKLDKITDVCPTCGQKIKGIEKPNTDAEKARLAELKIQLNEALKEKENIESERDGSIKNCKERYDSEFNILKQDFSDAQTKIAELKLKLRQLNQDLQNVNNELTACKLKKEEYYKRVEEIQKNIGEITININIEEDKILYNTKEKNSLDLHLSTVSKMLTIAKRDFRGFLLTNIIDFINKKSKEYCKEVFDTEGIEFILDGNNIAINYLNKPYENLSGGERQKVDVIIQLALRSMLCKFSSFSSNILVLDELFDGLDATGCQKIIDLITRQLVDIESVFIITHHADISIPADSIIKVVKDINGISTIR